MIFCPNINDLDFQKLLKTIGASAAYEVWNNNKGLPPYLNEDGTLDELFAKHEEELGFAFAVKHKFKIGDTSKGRVFSKAAAVAFAKSIDSSFDESHLDILTFSKDRASLHGVSLGSYLNGIIKVVSNEKGFISEDVFFHELMHRIYERNLTSLEQATLKTQFGQNMTDLQFKEFVSNEFAKFVQTNAPAPNSIFEKLFNYVIRFVRMLVGRTKQYDSLDSFFHDIMKGGYAVAVQKGSEEELFYTPSQLVELGGHQNIPIAQEFVAEIFNNLLLSGSYNNKIASAINNKVYTIFAKNKEVKARGAALFGAMNQKQNLSGANTSISIPVSIDLIATEALQIIEKKAATMKLDEGSALKTVIEFLTKKEGSGKNTKYLNYEAVVNSLYNGVLSLESEAVEREPPEQEEEQAEGEGGTKRVDALYKNVESTITKEGKLFLGSVFIVRNKQKVLVSSREVFAVLMNELTKHPFATPKTLVNVFKNSSHPYLKALAPRYEAFYNASNYNENSDKLIFFTQEEGKAVFGNLKVRKADTNNNDIFVDAKFMLDMNDKFITNNYYKALSFVNDGIILVSPKILQNENYIAALEAKEILGRSWFTSNYTRLGMTKKEVIENIYLLKDTSDEFINEEDELKYTAFDNYQKKLEEWYPLDAATPGDMLHFNFNTLLAVRMKEMAARRTVTAIASAFTMKNLRELTKDEVNHSKVTEEEERKKLPEEVQNQIEEAESAIQQTLEGVPTGPSVQYNIYDIKKVKLDLDKQKMNLAERVQNTYEENKTEFKSNLIKLVNLLQTDNLVESNKASIIALLNKITGGENKIVSSQIQENTQVFNLRASLTYILQELNNYENVERVFFSTIKGYVNGFAEDSNKITGVIPSNQHYNLDGSKRIYVIADGSAATLALNTLINAGKLGKPGSQYFANHPGFAAFANPNTYFANNPITQLSKDWKLKEFDHYIGFVETRYNGKKSTTEFTNEKAPDIIRRQVFSRFAKTSFFDKNKREFTINTGIQGDKTSTFGVVTSYKQKASIIRNGFEQYVIQHLRLPNLDNVAGYKRDAIINMDIVAKALSSVNVKGFKPDIKVDKVNGYSWNKTDEQRELFLAEMLKEKSEFKDALWKEIINQAQKDAIESYKYYISSEDKETNYVQKLLTNAEAYEFFTEQLEEYGLDHLKPSNKKEDTTTDKLFIKSKIYNKEAKEFVIKYNPLLLDSKSDVYKTYVATFTLYNLQHQISAEFMDQSMMGHANFYKSSAGTIKRRESATSPGGYGNYSNVPRENKMLVVGDLDVDPVSIQDIQEITQMEIPTLSRTKILPGVKELFNSNPELAKLGTIEQYSRYLDTIFPDSKVKDIVYHHSDTKITEFKKEFPEGYAAQKGVSPKAKFFLRKPLTEEFLSKRPYIGQYLINIVNPNIMPVNADRSAKRDSGIKEGIQEALNKGQDGAIFDNIWDNRTWCDVLVVFEPEQIHILGGKQDIERFTEFVNNDNESFDYEAVKAKYEEVISTYYPGFPNPFEGKDAKKVITQLQENFEKYPTSNIQSLKTILGEQFDPTDPDIGVLIGLFSGSYKSSDGQGVHTSARKEQVISMFGPSANVTDILKPLINDINDETGVPLIVKYSDAHLSEAAQNRNPVIKRFVEFLSANGYNQVIHPSAIKTGGVVKALDFKTLLAELAKDGELPKYSEQELKDATIAYKNSNFKIQLNPYSNSTKISYDSQFTYFSLFRYTNENGQKVIEKMGQISDINTQLVLDKAVFEHVEKGLRKNANTSDTKVDSKLQATLAETILKQARKGEEINIEELQKFLDNPLSPNFMKSLLNSIATSFKHKYRGRKAVLSADFLDERVGIIQRTHNGKTYSVATAIVPKGKKINGKWEGLLTEEMQNLIIKINKEIRRAEKISDKQKRESLLDKLYLQRRALAFRIPTTEIHSALPLEIIDFYDDRTDQNNIIVSKEVVLRHGSDYDVDSLFMMSTYEYEGKDDILTITTPDDLKSYLNSLVDSENKQRLNEAEIEQILNINTLDSKSRSVQIKQLLKEYILRNVDRLNLNDEVRSGKTELIDRYVDLLFAKQLQIGESIRNRDKQIYDLLQDLKSTSEGKRILAELELSKVNRLTNKQFEALQKAAEEITDEKFLKAFKPIVKLFKPVEINSSSISEDPDVVRKITSNPMISVLLDLYARKTTIPRGSFTLRRGNKIGYNSDGSFNYDIEEILKANLYKNGKIDPVIADIYKKYLYNYIFETKYDIITPNNSKNATNEDRDNLERMTATIDLSIADEDLIKIYGYSEPSFIDNHSLNGFIKSHKLATSGIFGTGISANTLKELAYTLNSIRDSNEDLFTDPFYAMWTTVISPTDKADTKIAQGRDRFPFTTLTENQYVLRDADAIVNLNIDNIKEQKLYMLNITADTNRAYLALRLLTNRNGLLIGLSPEDVEPNTGLSDFEKNKKSREYVHRLFTQPIIKYLSETNGIKKGPLSGPIVAAMNYLNVNLNDILELPTPKIEDLIEQNEHSKSKDNYDEILDANVQKQVLATYIRAHIIGQELTKTTDYINLVRSLPDNPSEYQEILSKVEVAPATNTIEFKEGFTNYFNLEDFFTRNPNISSVVRALSSINDHIISQSFNYGEIVNNLVNDITIKNEFGITDDEETRKEIIAFFASGLVHKYFQNENINDYTQLTEKLGKKITLLKYLYPDNEFIQSIFYSFEKKQISYQRAYSTMDYSSIIPLQEAFLKLSEYNIELDEDGNELQNLKQFREILHIQLSKKAIEHDTLAEELKKLEAITVQEIIKDPVLQPIYNRLKAIAPTSIEFPKGAHQRSVKQINSALNEFNGNLTSLDTLSYTALKELPQEVLADGKTTLTAWFKEYNNLINLIRDQNNINIANKNVIESRLAEALVHYRALESRIDNYTEYIEALEKLAIDPQDTSVPYKLKEQAQNLGKYKIEINPEDLSNFQKQFAAYSITKNAGNYSAANTSGLLHPSVLPKIISEYSDYIKPLNVDGVSASGVLNELFYISLLRKDSREYSFYIKNFAPDLYKTDVIKQIEERFPFVTFYEDQYDTVIKKRSSGYLDLPLGEGRVYFDHVVKAVGSDDLKSPYVTRTIRYGGESQTVIYKIVYYIEPERDEKGKVIKEALNMPYYFLKEVGRYKEGSNHAFDPQLLSKDNETLNIAPELLAYLSPKVIVTGGVNLAQIKQLQNNEVVVVENDNFINRHVKEALHRFGSVTTLVKVGFAPVSNNMVLVKATVVDGKIVLEKLTNVPEEVRVNEFKQLEIRDISQQSILDLQKIDNEFTTQASTIFSSVEEKKAGKTNSVNSFADGSKIKSLTEVLDEVIVATSEDPDNIYYRLYSAFKQEFGDTIENSTVKFERITKKNVAGFYSSETDSITLSNNPSLFDSQNELFVTLTHEILHLATAKTMRAIKLGGVFTANLTEEQKRSAKKIDHLYNALKRKTRKGSKAYKNILALAFKIGINEKELEYFMKNSDEFIAHAFSDYRFQLLLANISLDTVSYKPDTRTSILSELWELIKSFLPEGIANNVLDELFYHTAIVASSRNQMASVKFKTNQNYYQENNYGFKTDEEGLKKQYNPDGTEKDFYLADNGDQYTRTNSILPTFFNPYFEATEDFIERRAEKLYEGLAPDAKLKMNLRSGLQQEVTKDEYIELHKMYRRYTQLKGNLIEARLRQGISPSDENAEKIRSIIPEFEQLQNLFWPKQNTTGFVFTNTYDFLEKDAQGVLFINGIDVTKDKVHYDLQLSLPSLKIAGSPDIVAKTSNGKYILSDIKTGQMDDVDDGALNRFSDFLSVTMIGNNLNKAKLQIMMYAIMLRVKNPNMEFEKLNIIKPHMRQFEESSDLLKSSPSDLLTIDNPIDYLTSWKLMFKTMKDENGVSYYDLLEQEVIANGGTMEELFNPSAYHSNPYVAKDEQEAEELANLSIAEHMENALEDISKLSAFVDIDKDGVDQIATRYIGIKNELIERTERLAKLGSPVFNTSTAKISGMTYMLGQIGDISNEYVQHYAKVYGEHEQKFNAEYIRKMNLLNIKFSKMLQSKGLDPSDKQIKINQNKYFENFYVHENGIERFVTPNDSEWNNLNSAEQEYLTLVQKYIKEYVGDQASSFVNQIASETENSKTTHLEKYNSTKTANDKFEYYEGLIPKVPADGIEQYQNFIKQHGIVVGLWKKLMFHIKNNLTDFIRYQFENIESNVAVPLKYLGTGYINRNPHLYSHNVQHLMGAFIKEMEWKKHMEPVYHYGRGLKLFFENYESKTQSEDIEYPFIQIAKYMDARITLDIKKETRPFKMFGTSLVVNIPFGEKDEIKYAVKPDAIIRSITSLATNIAMFLRPLSVAGNMVNATIISQRRKLTNVIGKNLLGIPEDELDPNQPAYGKAHKDYLTYQKDLVTGDFRKNKLWLMQEMLDFLPKNYSPTKENKSVLADSGVFGLKSVNDLGYILNTKAEEAIAMTYLSSIARHYTVNGMKVFDYYVPLELDEDGNYANTPENIEALKNQKGNSVGLSQKSGTGIYQIEWIGGTRGFTKDGVAITGLTAEEIAKIKYTYDRDQGNYRKDQRLAIEVHALGSAFVVMKRYLPRIILNLMSSRKSSIALGKWKQSADGKTMTDPDTGEELPVMEWQAEMHKGTFRVLATLLSAAIKLPQNPDQFKLYWNELSSSEKLQMVNMVSTLFMWASFAAIYMTAFADVDDDDSFKRWFNWYIVNNTSQAYNPYELMKNAGDAFTPIAIKQMLNFTNSVREASGNTALYLLGDEEEALNREGEIKGYNKLLNYIPYVSWFKALSKTVENDKTFATIYK